MGAICPCCSKETVIVPVYKSRTPTPPPRTPTPLPRTPTPLPRTPTPLPRTVPTTPKSLKSRITSPSLPPEYSPEAPFTNLGVSKSNPLKLIEGYKNEPLVSLEEALAPFYGKINQLPDYIREAKSNCYYPSEHGLTEDESAAIYIYTMKWSEDCLYNKLHAAWQTEDRAEMKPWFKYLKLFKSAFDKLPDAKGEIWQGTSYDELLKDQFVSKPLTMYSAMGSCSSSKEVVEHYLEDRGNTSKIILGFKSIGGKLVGAYSANSSGGIIVWPGTKLGLSNMEVFGDTGSVIFHLTRPIGKCYCYSTSSSTIVFNS